MIALVTGVSSGFGLEAALCLARAGATVYGTVRSLNRADVLWRRARESGVHLELLEAELTRPETLERAVGQVLARHGRLDVLVNNAGIAIGGWFEDQADDEVREQFETNVFGLMALTRVVLPVMRAQRSGRIINVSSIGGRIGTPGLAPYCASKFAIEGFTESLRYEVAPDGVDVVLVEPGTYPTAIFFGNRRVARAVASSPRAERLAASEATMYADLERRNADPAEVGNAVTKVAFARHPPLRTIVGSDAKMGSWALKLLPARVFQWLMSRFYTRPSPRPAIEANGHRAVVHQ